jgi:hypothetical protein
VRSRPITVSTDRVTPAYIFSGTDHGNNTFNPPVDTTPAVVPPATTPQPTTQTTRSGHDIHFPTHFNVWAPISVGEWGGVMWKPPTVKQALPNQCSPWQLQCPLVRMLPSDKSIKMRRSDTLASVTATLTSREHCNSEYASSSTCSRLHQWSPALIRPAGLTVTSAG